MPTFAEATALYEGHLPGLTLYTSGSTGAPKPIFLSRGKLLAQAELQAKFFRLPAHEAALLCLSPDRIGGLMVMLRALVAGMPLVQAPATGNPLPFMQGHTFGTASLVPYQLQALLATPGGAEALGKIRVLLLGGAPTPGPLLSALRLLPNETYATYGMTETASHIAVMHLNGHEEPDYYTLLPGYTAGTDTGALEGCLWCTGPSTANTRVETQDVVSFADDTFTRFTFVGRADFAINSGGIKFYPEALEKAAAPIMAAHLPRRAYYFGGRPDAAFGQHITLFVEGTAPIPAGLVEALTAVLPPFGKPREMVAIPKFPRTDTGKVLRALEHVA